MSYISSERIGRVAHISFNRPQQQNQFTMEMLSTLGRLTRAADEDPGVGALLITGAGEDFCTGGDVADILEPWKQGINAIAPHDINPWGLGTRQRTKPLITIVQGRCINGGLELALACDICIAADNARFAFEEIRYGTYPFAGGVFRFIRAAGRSNALRYVFTGDEFGAEEALRMNLVAAVRPVTTVREFGIQMAIRIAAAAPLALTAALGQVHAWTNGGDAAGLERSIPDIVRLLNTADSAEAILALQQGRPAVFRGR